MSGTHGLDWTHDLAGVSAALFLVLLNGFFVAAEFALVKIRAGRVAELVRQGRPFAATALWLSENLEGALSACQLGITMASLGLGWVGEPAIARLLEPAFQRAGLTSPAALHTVSFVVAFTLISSLHLVIGEQAPKIFAIRRAEQALLWCAYPLKGFYLLTYPLMVALNSSTSFLLRLAGLKDGSEHEIPYTEHEIRALLREAHVHGQVTGSEHRLINAVFEFDDMICRRIMVPRNEVDFFDASLPVQECLELALRTKHTRYPVCDGSLDDLLGVVHVKDLVGNPLGESFEWGSVMRPPRKVPEDMPISRLLRHFQATHQLMAFVIDEYGTVIGIVTLENVLEQIIGAVDDEFDTEEPDIVPAGPSEWLVRGSAPLEKVERKLGIPHHEADVDTLSGLLVHLVGRLLVAGDRVALGPFSAEVLEVRNDCAFKVRVRKAPAGEAAP